MTTPMILASSYAVIDPLGYDVGVAHFHMIILLTHVMVQTNEHTKLKCICHVHKLQSVNKHTHNGT